MAVEIFIHISNILVIHLYENPNIRGCNTNRGSEMVYAILLAHELAVYNFEAPAVITDHS